MNSPSMRTDRPGFSIQNQRGSVLPIVLIFATCGLITVLIFHFHQLTTAKPSLRSPSSLQALLNARSGIYKAIEVSKILEKASSEASTLDTVFGADLFDQIDSIFVEESITIGGPPVEVSLYDSEDFGSADASITLQGIYCVVEATGIFRNTQRTAQAKLGSKAPALPDTVLSVGNDYLLDREPRGVWVKESSAGDSAQTNNAVLEQFLSQFTSDFSDEMDSTFFDSPRLVQNSKEIAEIPDIVKGHLTINGTGFDLAWKEKRKVVIMGDLQIMGTVTVENMDLVVGGEVRFLDKATFTNVSVFCMHRVFLGGEIVFRGDILARHSINVYDDATVENRSSLITTGVAAQDSVLFSIIIAHSASVYGVCIALNRPGGIKTYSDVSVKGILWAQRYVCHLGHMYGFIRAAALIDCDDPEHVATFTAAPQQSPQPGTATTAPRMNKLPGTLLPSPDISLYNMPFFIGRPQIVSWIED